MERTPGSTPALRFERASTGFGEFPNKQVRWKTNQARLVAAAPMVTARNTDTGLTRIATSDAEGRYLLASLPLGEYEVRANRTDSPRKYELACI